MILITPEHADLVAIHERLMLVHMAVCLLFFFFQAEDGIRDTSVTGVQTCALPIWRLDVSINRIRKLV